MTEAEVSRLVRAVEQKSSILALRLDGISPWQLVRFEVSLALQNLSPRRQNAVRLTILKRSVTGILQSVSGIREADFVCKTFDSALRVFDEGAYRDIYFDSILERRPGGAKISSSDAAGYDGIREKAKIAPVFDDTSIIALSAVLGRIIPRYARHPVFNAIANAIQSEAGLHSFTASRVARVFNVFWWRVRLYRMLLRRMGVKSVFAADSGQFALMRASQDLNIPFVEVQHGVCTNIHPNMLPDDVVADAESGLLLPSSFAVYGEHSKDALSGTLLSKKDRIVRVGAPYIDVARATREREWHADEPPVLTVTAQGVAMEQLGEFLSQFLVLCDEDLVLNIKLHPAYNGDEAYYRERFAGDPRVHILSGQSEVGTHHLIALSHMHLSISSTCHYDALGIGTPTGVLALETHESVIDILGNEGAVLLQSPKALVDLVKARRFPVVPDSVQSHFFEEEFAANMAALIPR